MDYIPEGLVLTPESFQNTANPGVKKPLYGSLGTQHVEFMTHRKYSGKKTKEQGQEAYDEIDVLMIRNDKFSRVPKRMNELTHQQKMALAPLYERFKEGKDSTDTNILNWGAASNEEKAHLGNIGVWTVEQIAAFADHELTRLGPDGKDLRRRARLHVKAKSPEVDERKKELDELRALVEAQAEQIKELKEQDKPRRGRPKKQETEG